MAAGKVGKGVGSYLSPVADTLFPWGKALMNFHFRLTRIVRGLESRIPPAEDHKSADDVPEYRAGENVGGEMRLQGNAREAHRGGGSISHPRHPAVIPVKSLEHGGDGECSDGVSRGEAFLP